MPTVISADGTPIAYEVSGTGPAVILVATALADRHDLDGLAAALSGRFTVYNYDRRGRGESGDVQPYAPNREVEDIDALLDAIGAPAYLFGGSAGCVLALDAASALGDRIAGLFLYEPPFVVGPGRAPVPDDYVEHVEALVRAERRDEAVAYFMTRAVGVPEEYIEPMRADPSWQTMCRHAHTLAYDGRIVAGTQTGTALPADRWKIARPVHVAVGSGSEPFLHDGARALATVLSDAAHHPLPGLDHGSLWSAPQAVAEAVAGHLLAPADGPSAG